MTSNKEIQSQRIRGYFIQATKEILIGEGLRGVSVRNVARQAGYSYATLYNYFKDAKDLVFECVVDFQEECREQVLQDAQQAAPGKDRLKAIALAYIKYFVQYPGVFELFYLERPHNLASKQPTVKLIATFLERLSMPEWDYCVQTAALEAEQSETYKQAYNNLITGMLMLYLGHKHPAEYKQFMQQVHQQLDLLLATC